MSGKKNAKSVKKRQNFKKYLTFFLVWKIHPDKKDAKKMKKLVLVVFCLSLGLAAISACSSSGGGTTGPTQVSSYEELGECDSLQEGVTKYVASEEQYYKCREKTWIETVYKPKVIASETMRDSRDGQAYKIITIGTQTWMAENLNYETENSFCYENESSNCKKYGRLYIWAAAKDACPKGWHLPTKEEFEILVDYVGGEEIAGKMLKSTSGWHDCDYYENRRLPFECHGLIDGGNGLEAFGFNALPVGVSFPTHFDYLGDDGSFWSATEYDSKRACYLLVAGDRDEGAIDCNIDALKKWGYPVRCIKD